MVARKLSLPTIRKVGLALPAAEEGASCGMPAFRFRKKLIARLHQDGESLVLMIGNETRDHLMKADPETFSIHPREEQMKLYFSNGSPFARKVRVVLAELGLVYETDILDGLRPTSSPPGPTIAIPVLEDGPLRLWESDLIVDYLLRTYPVAQPAGQIAQAPLSPWMARPERHWQDMTVLATIATCATSIVNLRLMQPEGITPDSSAYMARQKARVERCLDWLETQVTDDGFAPGWFSIMDVAFFCPVAFCEARSVMPWRGRPKLEALYDRCRTRPSLLATPIGALRPS